ncbi:MAG: hypothetical protein ABIG20_03390 [archaeon]
MTNLKLILFIGLTLTLLFTPIAMAQLPFVVSGYVYLQDDSVAPNNLEVTVYQAGKVTNTDSGITAYGAGYYQATLELEDFSSGDSIVVSSDYGTKTVIWNGDVSQGINLTFTEVYSGPMDYSDSEKEAADAAPQSSLKPSTDSTVDGVPSASSEGSEAQNTDGEPAESAGKSKILIVTTVLILGILAIIILKYKYSLWKYRYDLWRSHHKSI